VVNSGSGSISEIDQTADAVVTSVNVGADPEYVVPGGNYLYVANVQSKTVSVVFTQSANVVKTISLAGTPVSIASAAETGNVFVGEQDGNVEVIDTASNTTIGHFQTTGTLGGVGAVFNGNTEQTNTAIVATNDGKVQALVGSNGTYNPFSTFTVPAGTLTPQTRVGKIYVFNQTSNQVSSIAPKPSAAEWTAATGKAPRGIDFDAGNQRLVVANSGDDTLTYLGGDGKPLGTVTLTKGAQPYDVVSLAGGMPVSPSPSPTSSSTPAAGSHLYVADYLGNTIEDFDAPFTSSSVPAFSLTANEPWGLATNSQYVASSWSTGVTTVYSRPLGASSLPIAAFGTDANGFAAFDPSGNLWVSNQSNVVYEYTPPFTNAMSPAKTLSNLDEPTGVAFDSSGTMYLTFGGLSKTVEALAPPYTGTPVAATVTQSQGGLEGDAVSGNMLAVADSSNSTSGGYLRIYTLPLTSSSQPAFSLQVPAFPMGVTFDAAGDLFVASVSADTVLEYKAPVTASSIPAVTITIGPAGSMTHGPAGIAVP
jgi:YVTN family beta-propeller protein